MSDTVGIQAVRAVLSEAADRARVLYTQVGRRDGRVSELISLARDAGVRHESMEAAWFRRRAGETRHQGVLLECHELALSSERDLHEHLDGLDHAPLLLVLDGVTDPRNLGACLRSANGAGVDAVVLPKRHSAPLSPTALKAAQGGAEALFIAEVTNLARALDTLKAKGVWLAGADGDAASTLYSDYDATGPTALVMGSEGKGLRRLTREACDALVRIPMAGTVESLNVAVATGILLYEIVRQRAR